MIYIEKVPQPFLDDLVCGQVIPFVGAGLSQNASPPLPTFNAIGARLANQIPDYVYRGNPSDAVAAYQQAFSRSQLIEELAVCLNPPDSEPDETMLAFAKLPFELVATTNFDLMLEKAYAKTGMPVNPQVTQGQLGIKIAGGINLFKFHGDFNHPEQITVTEEDYDAFASRFPLTTTYLAYLLTAFTPFYVGYSLDDYDFRSILRLVGERLGDFQRLGYTVQVGADPETILRFRRRNVYVINYQGDPRTDYPKVLTGLFQELLDYWLEHLLAGAIFTDQSVAGTISQTEANPNPLCFLAVPPQLLAAYKDKLNPLILEKGYTPCSVSNIYSHRQSDIAVFHALAKRADKIISIKSYPLSQMLQTSYPARKNYFIDNSIISLKNLPSTENSLLKSIAQWLEQK